MDIQESIKVMQAFEDGKTIQSRFLNDEWKDNPNPKWNWETCSYRIKPEPILPKTWEEFCKNHPIQKGESYIQMDSSRTAWNVEGKRIADRDRNVLPNEKDAEAMLALCQLIQLRDCYNDGWQPDWTDNDSHKFAITIDGGCPMPIRTSTESYVMAFKNPDLQNAFLKNFQDLIEVAKPLL